MLAEQQRTPVVVLFHSVLGLRPAVGKWAAELRRAGYETHTPDLYDGAVFDTISDGEAMVDALGGIAELVRRTQAAVAPLPANAVYAGFSNGGASAELLAGTMEGARGAVLMHAALPPQALGISAWPKNVPVQVHYGTADPYRSEPAIAALSSAVRQSGSRFELCDYPVSGHLFADPDLADYNAHAARLMLQRTIAFLRQLDS